MKILLIEDEHFAAEKMKKLIHDINESSTVIDVLDSVESSIEWLQNNDHPDLILSDIHLADGICFTIYATVNVQCPIIFVTAYEKYAIKAFEVNSIDYLLKPIQKERLQQAIEKYESTTKSTAVESTALFTEFKALMAQANKEYKSRFLCKLGNKIKSVPTESIRYFYSKDKLTFLIDENNNRFPVNNNLEEIDSMLDPKFFFRVNRKYIIHFDGIDEIHPYFKGRLKLKLNPNIEDDIVVSTERSPLFKAWLDR
jgi:DNA-binding LytR/AlgR family response regulator